MYHVTINNHTLTVNKCFFTLDKFNTDNFESYIKYLLISGTAYYKLNLLYTLSIKGAWTDATTEDST